MNLKFNAELAKEYKSPSQQARVLTEDWVRHNIYCPNCGNDELNKYCDNKPVADFYCSKCKEDYELKSKKGTIGNIVMDGEYNKKMERLKEANNPNLLLLNYDKSRYEVLNFYVIPRFYFVPDIIVKRKPLSSNAKRAGWIGSNILLNKIPDSGKIALIENSSIFLKKKVLFSWEKVSFLKEQKELKTKGWILDIMNCIDKLDKKEFSLNEIYSFERSLMQKHPENKHIKDKIRQQLQVLRDKNYLKFVGNGEYRLI
ncbi:MAG: DpnI domain-containing protein [Elusimicrobiota bacterium]|nr:restriction endonuclease [Elusimicrobiota bacterium]